MNIASSTSVQSATTAAQGQTSDAVNMLVLKKALNTQAAAAIGLLQGLPQPQQQPQLATQGSVGTRLNTFA